MTIRKFIFTRSLYVTMIVIGMSVLARFLKDDQFAFDTKYIRTLVICSILMFSTMYLAYWIVTRGEDAE